MEELLSSLLLNILLLDLCLKYKKFTSHIIFFLFFTWFQAERPSPSLNE